LFFWSIKKNGTQESQALGRSKGGFTTKVHGVCDALGNPLHFILSPGQASDSKYAIPLIHHLRYKALLADKGYDADSIISHILSNGARAIIPSKKNRLVKRNLDAELYKERHKIECLFGFLKHYRRLFSRFEKYASRFMAFLHFVSTLQWLK
jgi:transposase